MRLQCLSQIGRHGRHIMTLRRDARSLRKVADRCTAHTIVSHLLGEILSPQLLKLQLWRRRQLCWREGASTVHVVSKGIQLGPVVHFLHLQSIELLLEVLNVLLEALELGLQASMTSVPLLTR